MEINFMYKEVIFFKLLCNIIKLFKFIYFFLIFFKFGKGNIKVFIYMFIFKEFDSFFVYFSCMGKIIMFFFKAGIFDLVFYIRMYENKCRGIKEILGKVIWFYKNFKFKLKFLII